MQDVCFDGPRAGPQHTARSPRAARVQLWAAEWTSITARLKRFCWYHLPRCFQRDLPLRVKGDKDLRGCQQVIVKASHARR